MKEKVLEKLNVNEKELELFNREKNNFYITEKLFIKNNKTYKIKITLDPKSIGYLLNNITEKDLLYTLYEGKKIIAKNNTINSIKTKIISIL